MSINFSTTELEIYQALFEKNPAGVVLLNDNGKILWMNTLCEQYLRQTAHRGDMFFPEDRWHKFHEILQGQQSFYYTFFEDQGYMLYPQIVPKNRVQQILIRMMPANSQQLDIAALQEDLVQQRKLANLGKMMMELAHELNNPLTGISMGAQLIEMSMRRLRQLLMNPSENETAIMEALWKIEQELNRISESTSRAANLRHELLSYTKPNTLDLKPYQTKKLIQRALNNFGEHPIFRNMQLYTAFEKASPTIFCDPAKFEQILYNLVKNAHDATQGKGTVWIRETIQDKVVCIEVEDNGPGVPANMLDKIFSPFLTTKPRSGTGLGLSISQQIILQHGGTFSVYNKAGSGACFEIKLPLLQEFAATSAETESFGGTTG